MDYSWYQGPGPFGLGDRDRFSSVGLYRLRDGRFQIIKPGHMPLVIEGPDHVLVREELAGFLRRLQLEGVQLVPVLIYDRSTGQTWSDYSELLVANEVTVESISQVDLSGMKMWRYGVNEGRCVWVSPELRDRLLAEGFATLSFSPPLFAGANGLGGN